MSEILLILPAYNEEKNIEEVYRRILACNPGIDLLVVDDGSSDGTSQVCRRIGAKSAKHRVNLGLASAVRTGMKYAYKNGYEYAMQFDSDGQHDETKIGEMLAKAKKTGADIVIGSRFLEGDRPSFPKSLGKDIISFCIRLTCGKKLTDPTSGMRLYSRSVISKFALSPHFSPEPDMLAFMIRKGVAVTEVQVTMRERSSGRSYLDAVEAFRYMFRMITSILIVQWFR